MKYKCLEKYNKEKPKKRKILSFFNKMLTAVVICLVCLIVMEYSPKFKSFINDDVLSNNISFGFFDKIYNKFFGKVLPSSNNVVSVFNEKLDYKNSEKYLDGYKLEVNNNYLVPSLLDGVISYIGEKEDIGNVIVVEQTDGVTVTYGYLKNNNVKLYDHIEKGSLIGETKDNYLYLSFLKDKDYLDIKTYLS